MCNKIVNILNEGIYIVIFIVILMLFISNCGCCYLVPRKRNGYLNIKILVSF